VFDKFRVVFFTTSAFTLLNLAISVFVALKYPDTQSAMVTELYGTCIKLFAAGVGAIIGLLGGQSLRAE
jgi:uncharacterized membrane protein